MTTAGHDYARTGTRRPRWVEAYGAPAIIVSEVGSGLLIRYAAGRGGYHWVHRDHVTRRPDLDHSPDPAWLAQARISPRPPRVLWALLHDDDEREAPPIRYPFDFDTDADGRPR